MTSDAESGLLVQRFVYAGLDALRAAVPLDLAAYLHHAPDQGPQLFLGSPTLADIDPTAAFNLFGALRDGLGAPGDDDDIDVPGYRAIAVRTAGDRSRGVHVLGRRDDDLTSLERETIARLARTFAALAHDAESIGEPATGAAPDPVGAAVVRVLVQTVDGGAEASVEARIAGAERTETATASSTTRAVAMAAVACVDPSLKVVEAGEEAIGDARAMLALVAGEDGRQMLGAALVDDRNDLLRAAATAAIDAATRLAGR